MRLRCARTVRITIYEFRITKEDVETCSAKRTQTSRKQKAGNGKGLKGRSTKYEGRKGMECGIRIAERGFPIAVCGANHGPRIRKHEPRKTSVAEQTHFGASPMPRRQSGSRHLGTGGRATRGNTDAPRIGHDRREQTVNSSQWAAGGVQSAPCGSGLAATRRGARGECRVRSSEV